MLTIRKSQDRSYADHAAGSSRITAFPLPGTTTPATWAGATCASSTMTASPRHGLCTHGHRDMEIIGYVLSGNSPTRTAWATSRHPTGRRAAYERGHRRAAQRVQPCRRRDHAFPADLDRAARWRAARLRTKTIAAADKDGRLRLVASPDGAQDSVTIHADARPFMRDCSTPTRPPRWRWTRHARPTYT